jgi:hypothetical protein
MNSTDHATGTPAPEWLRDMLTHPEHARITTDAPAAVAEYLRALLARSTQYATADDGTACEVVTADTLRHRLTDLWRQSARAAESTSDAHQRTAEARPEQ